jgi:dihydroorotase
MAEVMSKMLSLGMDLEAVVRASTWRPAQVIGRTDLGKLSVGADADVAVFAIREGEFGFTDTKGVRRAGNRRLETELTFRAGQVVWDLNGRAATK